MPRFEVNPSLNENDGAGLDDSDYISNFKYNVCKWSSTSKSTDETE